MTSEHYIFQDLVPIQYLDIIVVPLNQARDSRIPKSKFFFAANTIYNKKNDLLV